MKKQRKTLVGLGASVVVGLISYFLYQHFMYVSTENAQVDAHTVILAAKIGGYVTSVKVREGDRVKAGEVLAEIDPRDYANAVTRMQGELVSLQARARDNERNYRRMHDLYDKGVVSQQQFDASSASYQETKAKFDAVAAQVEQAKLDLTNTKIVAPRDGFVAKKSVEVGQLAAPGVALIGFVGSDERWVTANFKETEIADIRIGAPVYVSVDALGGKIYGGKVESISAATGATFTLLPPDNATGNFTKVVQRVPVKISLDKLTDRDIEMLRAGLSVIVSVTRGH